MPGILIVKQYYRAGDVRQPLLLDRFYLGQAHGV